MLNGIVWLCTPLSCNLACPIFHIKNTKLLICGLHFYNKCIVADAQMEISMESMEANYIPCYRNVLLESCEYLSHLSWKKFK